jgi:hypothetical protein
MNPKAVSDPMYYDEQTRQFNLASGLVLGALLGAGLTLALLPRPEPQPRTLLRQASSAVRKPALRALGSTARASLTEALRGRSLLSSS